jgi:DNA-binding NtrC family response regulator
MAFVLVVDDEVGIRLTVKAFLERAGYETAVAEDGREALQVLERTRPDLILMDFLMPGVCGRRLLELFFERVPGVPLVVMTGDPSSESLAVAAALPAVGRLRKPFTKDALLLMVADALSQPAMARETSAGCEASSSDRAG